MRPFVDQETLLDYKVVVCYETLPDLQTMTMMIMKALPVLYQSVFKLLL